MRLDHAFRKAGLPRGEAGVVNCRLLNDERCATDPVTGQARIIESDAIDISESTEYSRTEVMGKVTATC